MIFFYAEKLEIKMEKKLNETSHAKQRSGIAKVICLLIIVLALGLSVYQGIKNYDGLITVAVLLISILPLIFLALFCLSNAMKMKNLSILLALLAVIAQMIVFGISGYQWKEVLVGNLMFILAGVNVLLLMAHLLKKDTTLVFILEALVLGMAVSQIIFGLNELKPGILLIFVFAAKLIAYRYWLSDEASGNHHA